MIRFLSHKDTKDTKEIFFVVLVSLWKTLLRRDKFNLTLILSALLFITSCSNRESPAPFAEILNQAPYTEITDSIKREPQKDELYFHRAVLLNKNNFPEPALADFRKAWTLKKDERYAFGISTILLDRKTDSAILFLNEAMKELPQSILLPINLAHAYAAQNKTEEALNLCNRILQIDSGQLNILLLKADLLDKKGNADESIVTLEKAYVLDPRDPDLSHSLAFKYAQNKSPKAIPFCDSLILKDPAGSRAEPYYFKGVYYSNMNDKAKALSFFNLAIQHNYNFLDAHMEKGQLLYDQKKINEALRAFMLVTTISPTFADAYFWIGKCQQDLGQKEEARLNYQRAYGLDKTLTEAKEAADRIIN
jgi:tetratricopeptide (TPR) repeat protein